MSCQHEEADTRMFFHLAQLNHPKNVVVRTADTDCLVIALGCKSFYHCDTKIWLEVGTQATNTRRYISVDQIQRKLGDTLCTTLPAYHAFTGCDYTASFCRKGKVRPFKILEKREDFQAALLSLGRDDQLNEATVKKLEEFVCIIYGRKKCKSVDEARFEMFCEKYKSSKISTAKKLDSGMLPPCSKVLRKKIERCKLISKRWMSSSLQEQPTEEPESSGWFLKDDQYHINWFDGEETPNILDIVGEDCEGNF